MLIVNKMAKIRFNIIVIFPIRINLNVKNNKHQSTLIMPLTINNIKVLFGSVVLFTHIAKIIANDK
jgi:hypothetical protein